FGWAGSRSSGDGFRPRPSPRSGARQLRRGRSSSELPLRPARCAGVPEGGNGAWAKPAPPLNVVSASADDAARPLRGRAGGRKRRTGKARTPFNIVAASGDDAARPFSCSYASHGRAGTVPNGDCPIKRLLGKTPAESVRVRVVLGAVGGIEVAVPAQDPDEDVPLGSPGACEL